MHINITYYILLIIHVDNTYKSRILYSLFLLYGKFIIYQNILKATCKPLTFTSYQAFLKIKRGLEPVTLPHFLHNL